MSEETGTRRRGEAAERQARALQWSSEPRQLRPTECGYCHAAAPEFGRFCETCGHYLADPYVGRLASSRRRLAASMLDSVMRDGGLIGSAFASLLFPAGVAPRFVAVVSAIYWVGTVALWRKGTTPAKRLFDMHAVSEDGKPADWIRMALRETVGKYLSMVVMGLGFLTIPFHREKRGWHDRMFGTWVVVDDED